MFSKVKVSLAGFALTLSPVADEESNVRLSLSESPEDKGDEESQPLTPIGVPYGGAGSEHAFGDLMAPLSD